MFVHNDVSRDSRVLKEATSLAWHGWRVLIVGVSLDGPPLPEIEEQSGFVIHRVSPGLLLSRAKGTYGKLLRLLVALPAIARIMRTANARVYHAHDFTALLMMALAGIWRRPIVYDSHELFFDRFPSDRPYLLKYVIRLFRPLEKLLARRAVAVITVSSMFAETLQRTLGIAPPTILLNVVDLRTLEPAVPLERHAGTAVVAHSGLLIQGRHLAELVSTLRLLPETVTLALIGDGYFRERLVAQAVAEGTADRLIMVYPVTPFNIATTLSQADVAAVLITSTRKSYDLTLPNKVFEAIAAGLPMIASPTTALAQLFETNDLGILCDPTDPQAIADAIQRLLEPATLARYRAGVAEAKRVFNWEIEEKKLVALYTRLLGPGAVGGELS